VGLHERLSAAIDHRLSLTVRAVGSVTGRVLEVGDGWLLLATPDARGLALVPFTAVTGVTGFPARVDAVGRGRRFGLGYALRGLSRDRSTVLLTDFDGLVVSGTIDAVGRDVLELSEHAPDLPRRPENVTGRRLVPFSAVVLLRPARQAGTRWDQS
jgi:hypothetical protein